MKIISINGDEFGKKVSNKNGATRLTSALHSGIVFFWTYNSIIQSPCSICSQLSSLSCTMLACFFPQTETHKTTKIRSHIGRDIPSMWVTIFTESCELWAVSVWAVRCTMQVRLENKQSNRIGRIPVSYSRSQSESWNLQRAIFSKSARRLTKSIIAVEKYFVWGHYLAQKFIISALNMMQTICAK